jgi:hypothetical protein
MKTNKLPVSLIQLLLIITILLQSCILNDKNEKISVENEKLLLSFDRNSGALLTFTAKGDPYPFLDDTVPSFSPWEIEITDTTGAQIIGINNAGRFRHRKTGDTAIIMEWDRFIIPSAQNLTVSTVITLEKNKSMTSWKISLDGISGMNVGKVVFPRIKIAENEGEEYLAIPEWMGQLIKSPREHLASMKSTVKKYEWSYPGPLSMQCAALYTPGKRGFYAACNDTLAYRKNLAFTLDSSGNLIYQANNFPETNPSSDRYEPQYSSIIGSFTGDWITAAEIYREWGSKQKWSRESRFITGQTPEWLEKTALWVWNRGKSSNVLVPAADLQKRLGLPVSVFWHWWHGCSYDDGFPEYIPPREGKKSFISAMAEANEKEINAIVYMNQALWGTTTESWKDDGAERFAAKDSKGNILTHVFNIFSGKPTAYMCMGTQFWKDKYSSLCDSAVNIYGANGVYMDMACLNTMCFDKSHGHPVGGGNYHIQNFSKMTSLIRSKINDKENLVLAGEGAGEVWLPYLDLFLTLAVSKERYAGPGAWETIPFFQAVYHQYAVTYGNYSSLLVPPYDELWPKEFAPEEPLKMLDDSFNRQFLMEQARSFAWGLQPTISNYQSFLAKERKQEIRYLTDLAQVRNRGLQYMLHGKFLRTPHFGIPEKETEISRLSIYAGKMGESVTSFRGTYPLIYTGTWQSGNKSIGIALASISDDPLKISFSFSADEYALPESGKIYIIDPQGRRLHSSFAGKEISVGFTLKPKGLYIIEIVPEGIVP